MAFPLLPAAAIALSGAGLAGSFLQKKPKAPDISGELAQIRALIEQARASAKASIEADYNDSKMRATNDLAARGTYRAPVAQNTYNALLQGKQRALAQVEGDLAGKQAGLESSLFSALLGRQSEIDQLNAQRQAAIFGQLGGLGGTLLLHSMLKNPAAAPSADAGSSMYLKNDIGRYGYLPGSQPARKDLNLLNLYQNLIRG